MATTKVSTDVIDLSGNSEALTWVKGTTAQRGGSPTLGDLRENTEDNRTEIYTDQSGTSEWRNLKETAYDFTFSADFLVVAGGGAGGGNGTVTGGGGAGGLRTSWGSTSGGGSSAPDPLTLDISTAYTVTVGGGGAGNASDVVSASGSTSSISGSFTGSPISTTGGGGGGTSSNSSNVNGQAGGSGGGGGGATGASGSAGSGTTAEGFNGGSSTLVPGCGAGTCKCGGGGGAAGLGASNVTTLNNTPSAGAGLALDITGGSVDYATGGLCIQSAPFSPTANTGNGGVGGYHDPSGTFGPVSDVSGASGIVVLNYPTDREINSVGGSLTTGVLNGTAAGKKYTTFTGGTGDITFTTA